MSEVVSLLAVHGNGGGAARFADVEPHVGDALRWSSIDLPGFGTPLPPESERTMAGYAKLLAQALEDLPRPRVVLGHGIGGSFALELLRDDAALVDGVILHAPVGARLERRLFPRLMRPAFVRGALRRAIASPLLRPLWRRRLFTRPLERDVEARFFDGYRDCAAFGLMFDLITPAWWASLAPRDVPSTLLWGQKESILGVDQLDDYRALLPHAEPHVVPHWDHFPMLDDPADYARTVETVVRELRGRSSS